MTDEARLFDATPYTVASRQRSPRRRVSPVPPEVAMGTGKRWNGIRSKHHGIVHYTWEPGFGGAPVMSACGNRVVPHMYDPDEVRPCCTACLAEVDAREFTPATEHRSNQL